MAPVQRSFYFQLFIEDCASVISGLTIKMFVFQCIKSKTIGKYLPFVGLLVWIQKDRAAQCNACAVNQKVVTACFSGNALISMEPLVRIS